MSLVEILLSIIAILYGGMALSASIIGVKAEKIERKWGVLMGIGAFGVIFAIYLKRWFGYYGVGLVLLGLIMIHIAAVGNGLRIHGKLNYKHHIIRGLISLSLIVMLIIS